MIGKGGVRLWEHLHPGCTRGLSCLEAAALEAQADYMHVKSLVLCGSRQVNRL